MVTKIQLILSLVICLLSIASFVHGDTELVTHEVTFDISIGNQNVGKIVLGLFGNDKPKTVANFVAFARSGGVKGKSYWGSKFHRVIKNFLIQGGDVIQGNGRGSNSIYGRTFDDEFPTYKFKVPGLLSMSNAGPNTNGCQFFIATIPAPWLDGLNIIFGKVVDKKSMNTVKLIENTKVKDNKPLRDVIITTSSVRKLSESESYSIDIGKQGDRAKWRPYVFPPKY